MITFNISKRTSQWVLTGVLVYMPLHVFLSNWFGSALGVLDAAKVWKDGAVFLIFLAFVLDAWRTKSLLPLLKMRLVQLVLAYLGLLALYTLLFHNTPQARFLGLVYDARLFIALLMGMLTAKKLDNTDVRRLGKVAIGVATIIASIGIMQVAFLGNGLLSSFGYNRATGTPPAFYINDQAETNERAFSTLKDPNSLGVYLILPISLLLILLLSKNSKGQGSKKRITCLLFVLLACLALTYSRSAVIGLACATLVILNMYRKEQGSGVFWSARTKKIFGAVLLFCVIGFAMVRNSAFIQTTFFHIGEKNPTTSNSLRVEVLQDSLDLAQKQPYGYGVGAAGPVSVKNTGGLAIISENNYLQILLETGILGLLLFLAIVFQTGALLRNYRSKPLAQALLVSLVGISVAALFVHAWMNEAVAYTWWLLAGVVIRREVTESMSPKRQKTSKLS